MWFIGKHGIWKLHVPWRSPPSTPLGPQTMGWGIRPNVSGRTTEKSWNSARGVDRVDGSEIWRENHLGCKKFPVNNEINYQSQLVSRISCINSRSSVSSPILGGSSQLSLFWNLNLPFELAFSLPGFLDLWYWMMKQCRFRGLPYLEDHPSWFQWLGTPPLISHEWPFGSGKPESLGQED